VKECNILKEPMEIVIWTFVKVDADLERNIVLGGAGGKDWMGGQ